MYFVGVDLAWSPRRTSAVAAASGGEDGAKLTRWKSDLRGVDDVVKFIDETTALWDCLVAIDAPLAVPNIRGMRHCDRAVSSAFRPYRAGTHPVNRANLSRYEGFEGEALARRLLQRGFQHAVDLRPRQTVRGLFETYPHAAAVVLFRLRERIAYKARGSARPWAARKRALDEFRKHLGALQDAVPPMRLDENVLAEDLERLTGVERKRYEDLLDSLLCAYISYYYWFWGASRCTVVGNVEEGYMVLPINQELRRRLEEAEKLGKQNFPE
jgi:predicted RNase H-like nuclease